MVVSQRGRRLHLPEDVSTMTSPRMQVDGRVAWLLTTSRLLGPDPDLARRTVLISQLAQRGISLDAPRLSRLESGATPVGMGVIVGYEQVLGLTPGLLTATVTGVRRAFGAPAGPRERKSAQPSTDADLDQLLNMVADEAATGADWLRASRVLSRFDRVFLRQDDWSSLCGTLVQELATSAGIDHVRRFEAATALLQHPSARRHVSRAIGNFVMDPDAQVVAPVLNLLGEVTDPAASDLVLRLLSSPSRNLLRAATSVAATKVARGHFDAQAMPELERHLERGLAHGLDLDAGLDTLDLAVHVPRASWEAVESRLRDPGVTAMVVRVRSTRELITSRKAGSLAAEVATAIQDATPTHHPIETDMMLHRLVREALVHTHKARRHHAALLLSASPYGPATADQVLALTHHRDEFIAARAWAMLMRLPCPTPPTGPRQRTVDAMPDRHVARVLINVGIHDRPLDPATGAGLAARLPARRRSEHHGVLFALGMHGSPELEALSEHADSGVRRGAAWWLLQGGATRDDDSAAQRGSRAN